MKRLSLDSGSGSGSKLHSGGLILAPSSAQSPILSNVTFTSNTTEQPNKIAEISPRATESTDIAATESSSATKQHSHLNAKHCAHSSMQSIVYIAVIAAAALLFIAAGVFAFKMQQAKPKKEDLFADMNQ